MLFGGRRYASNGAILVPAAGGGSGLITSGLLDYWEADNLTKIYKEIAGTTNVSADGDTVGMWKGNLGTGFDLAAASDGATRPLYKTNGTQHWVLGDGVDDILYRAAALGMFGDNTRPCTIIAAVKSTADSQSCIVAEAADTGGGNNSTYFPLRTDPTDFNDIRITNRQSGGSYNLNAVLIGDEACPAATDVVLMVTDSCTLVTLYKDGSSLGNSGAYTRTGTCTPDRFALFGRRIVSSSDFFDGAIYGIWIYNRELDSSELAQMNTYAGTKQGRTI